MKSSSLQQAAIQAQTDWWKENMQILLLQMIDRSSQPTIEIGQRAGVNFDGGVTNLARRSIFPDGCDRSCGQHKCIHHYDHKDSSTTVSLDYITCDRIQLSPESGLRQERQSARLRRRMVWLQPLPEVYIYFFFFLL